MLDRPKLWATGLLIAAFAAGVAVGGAVSAAWGDRGQAPERQPRRETSFLDRLDAEVHLAPTQRDSVAAILRHYDVPLREMWQDQRQRVDSMRMRVRAEIMTVLDTEQQRLYRAMTARMDSIRAARAEGGRRDH